MEKEGTLYFHGKRRAIKIPWKKKGLKNAIEKEGPLKFHRKRRYLIFPLKKKAP